MTELANSRSGDRAPIEHSLLYEDSLYQRLSKPFCAPTSLHHIVAVEVQDEKNIERSTMSKARVALAPRLAS